MTMPLKWPGGKQPLARKIIALMPPRKSKEHPRGWCHYVEPYFGAGAVLFAQNPEGISEVVNDLDGALTNFWTVLQRDEPFQAFKRRVDMIPFSEIEWRNSRQDEAPKVMHDPEAAVNFFVRRRQSLVGRGEEFASRTRTRVRNGMNGEVSAWWSCIDGLDLVRERLKRVLILGPSEAITIIRKEDDRHTLFYLDPPYMHETRRSITEYGPYEQLLQGHANLLVTLGGTKAAEVCKRHVGIIPDWWQFSTPIKGRFLLSAYKSQLYDDVTNACGWRLHEFEVPNNASHARIKARKIECVYMNY